MKEIIVPAITANEDIIKLSKVLISTRAGKKSFQPF